MPLSFLAHTYQLAAPTLSAEQVDEVISEAVLRARQKHPDVDRFLTAMDFLSTKVFTDHRGLPLDAYIEMLYCAVKHGDFSREWRRQITRQRQALASETQRVH